jgi:threonine/homoserine/homoserine lactone efflux protein
MNLPAAFAAGAGLGLSAGLSPGPLFALVIAQTLAYGVREGAKVAAAPLLSDLPIVAAAVALAGLVSAHPLALALLTLMGAGYLAHCGWESLRLRPGAARGDGRTPRSVRKGVLANFLNPSPYLFWFGVGAPLLLRCWNDGPGAALGFLAGFYLCLVGAKLLVAWLTGRAGPVMGGPAYALVMRGLGVALFGYAGWFVREAWLLIR